MRKNENHTLFYTYTGGLTIIFKKIGGDFSGKLGPIIYMLTQESYDTRALLVDLKIDLVHFTDSFLCKIVRLQTDSMISA